MQNKLYIVTRKDLSKSQQAVQAGHALAEFILNRNTEWDNGTLVYLQVSDENELKRLLLSLESSNIDYVKFREPDRDNEITAIASLGSNKFFKKLNLL